MVAIYRIAAATQIGPSSFLALMSTRKPTPLTNPLSVGFILPKLYPSRIRDLKQFLSPTPVSSPDGISIGSSGFAGPYYYINNISEKTLFSFL